jgi:amino acid transporter
MSDVATGSGLSGKAELEPSLHRVMGPGLLLLFIVGDILGTGIYALTGQVAKQVGGVVWLPFLVAFVVALITAFSYLELVTKYPRAAGAALYTHKAFGIHFVTFLVAFAVMCSGITSASTASRAFAANFSTGFGLELEGFGITLVGLVFMALVATINFRGVGESLKVNVVLTCIELTGHRSRAGRRVPCPHLRTGGRPRRVLVRDCGNDAGFLRYGGLRGFGKHGRGEQGPIEDLPEGAPHRAPRYRLIYILVSVSAITLVPAAELGEGEAPLLKVVSAGAPGFPLGIFGLITMFAVANSALINMLMASRLVYGMSREGVLPPVFGRVHRDRCTPYVAIAFTSLLAFGLVTFVGAVPALGGTTALLLLGVFTIVNIAVLVLRKDKVDHEHFRSPTILPVLGAISCAFLVGPWTGRAPIQYAIAGILLAIGVVLWFVTVRVMRSQGLNPSRDELSRMSHSGPVN